MSDPIGSGKWVVEKFKKINPGLLSNYSPVSQPFKWVIEEIWNTMSIPEHSQ